MRNDEVCIEKTKAHSNEYEGSEKISLAGREWVG